MVGLEPTVAAHNRICWCRRVAALLPLPFTNLLTPLSHHLSQQSSNFQPVRPFLGSRFLKRMRLLPTRHTSCCYLAQLLSSCSLSYSHVFTLHHITINLQLSCPLLPALATLDPYHPASDLASEYTHRAYLRWDNERAPPWKTNHTSLLKNMATA
jgi:hypothetical protein